MSMIAKVSFVMDFPAVVKGGSLVLDDFLSVECDLVFETFCLGLVEKESPL
jgi:hypothetical protein